MMKDDNYFSDWDKLDDIKEYRKMREFDNGILLKQ